MDLLSVENLVVRYGGTVAVGGVSFGVRAGEVFGLIGPTGAGKTTTLRAIEGLSGRSGGQVRAMGLDPRTAPVSACSCSPWPVSRTSRCANSSDSRPG